MADGRGGQPMELKRLLRTIPDFPRPGIDFVDITPLLGHAEAFSSALEDIERFANTLGPIDAIAAPEARGFIVGAALASRLGLGFVPIRKPGKLPAVTESRHYELEYGEATLEVHRDAAAAGARLLVVDDLLATGGTVRAASDLLRSLKADVIGFAFLVELGFLHGREKLEGRPVHATILV